MYKTTDDEFLGKGHQAKFTRYSSSTETVTKKRYNTNKSNKIKKKDEYLKRTYLLLTIRLI